MSARIEPHFYSIINSLSVWTESSDGLNATYVHEVKSLEMSAEDLPN